MAYKFQRGTAILSGAIEVQSTDAELAVAQHDGTKVFEVAQNGNLSGSGNANVGTIQIASTNFVDASRNVQAANVFGAQLSGSGNLLMGGTVRFDGVAQAAVAVAADSILFVDADDNLVKKEGVGAFATDLAGTGLEQNSNTIRIASAAAGDGLTGGGGSALAVAVSGAVHIDGDKVSLTGSLAGDCLDKGPTDGVDAIRVLHVVADETTIESAGRDSLRIKDDGVTGAKLAPAVAGVGLAQDGSGNLDLALSELTAENIASGDFLAFQDVTDDGTHKETVDDLAALFAGAGLGAASAVISVQVSGALAVESDRVGISGSIAGIGLSFDGGVDSIESIDLDLNELSGGDIADGDSLAFIDANDSNVTKKESVADLAALFAGAGLGAASSVISVANASNGGLAINANDMQVDLNDLSDGNVNQAADSIAFIDADGNGSKKESIADFVAAIAGAGLAASAGKLSTQAGSVTQVTASSTALFEGYNYYTGSASKSLTLPASPSVGDVVYLKVDDLGDGNALTVNRAGSHTIDGETSIALESDYAAVGFVYLVANKWAII